MTPIQELLSRIRWDSSFRSSRFVIGYFDRVQGTILRTAFEQVSFPPDQRRVFELTDESGVIRRIPFHRVREIYRDGQLIWRRP